MSFLQSTITHEVTSFDSHFADLMMDLSHTEDKALRDIFVSLSRNITQQNACIDLNAYHPQEGESLIEKLKGLRTVTSYASGISIFDRPMVLAGSKLFLQKYFLFELNICKDLQQRNQEMSFEDISILNSLFPTTETTSDRAIDKQKLAAFQCLTRQLTVVTGGPGTGKTTIVVKILVALKKQNPTLKINLAAPTGKAATKLSETIRSSSLILSEEYSVSIPGEVSTIHRLLGVRQNGRSVRYHAGHKLDLDLLILDEVSMLDLEMFNRVLAALPKSCRLILLGDPEQLLSVDTGSILADLFALGQKYSEGYAKHIKLNLGYDIPAIDIIQETENQETKNQSGLKDTFCHLSQSYRFKQDKGIGSFATQIRNKQISDAFISDDEIEFIPSFNIDMLSKVINQQYQTYFELVKGGASIIELLETFSKTRILVPLRDGPYGISALNESIETNFLGPKFASANDETPIYHGKPIMITQNDYHLELFNGDIGICIKNTEGEFLVAFQDQGGESKSFLLSRLPAFETCFAMSIHKSQGSEFDTVCIIIPESQIRTEKLFTRELIYTAITRARTHVKIFAQKKDLMFCLNQSTERLSGLQDHLNNKW